MVHYSTDGFLLHRSSEDARRQLEAEKAADDAANRFQAEVGIRRGCGRAGAACYTSLAQMHCSTACSVWEAEGCRGTAPAPAAHGRQQQASCCWLLPSAATALSVCSRHLKGRMAAVPHQRRDWPLSTHCWGMIVAGRAAGGRLRHSSRLSLGT